MINFFYEDCIPLNKNNEESLKKTVQLFDKEGFTCGDISVVFCSDTYLLSLNKKYLNHDYFTDIITFPYNEGGRFKLNAPTPANTLNLLSLKYS